MKKFLTLLLAGVMASGAIAQDEAQEPQQLVNVDVAARFDWQNVSYDGHTDNGLSGFRANYVALRVDGSIIPSLTYSWRQRLSRGNPEGSFLTQTDWLYVNWKTGPLTLSGGKQIVAIGGYEYDRTPIDLTTYSLFIYNIDCFKIGVSASYALTDNDNILFQIAQSPGSHPGMRNIYSYNLLWSADHGCWHPIWSANMIEYQKGRYINYLALGNRFNFDRVYLEADFINRATDHQTYLFKDCTVAMELGWDINKRWKIFGKWNYDVNHSGRAADITVLDGTELNMAGGGVEFFPLRHSRRSLRLHANCFYAWGKNTNTADLMQSKTLFVSAGLTWDMNLLALKRK